MLELEKYNLFFASYVVVYILNLSWFLCLALCSKKVLTLYH